MSLFDISRELFSYMVSFREAAPHADSPGIAKVRADLDSLFARMEDVTKSNPVTSGGYGMIRYALVVFCDEVLTTSGWKHGEEWSGNCLERRYYDTQEAGQRFFSMALKLDDAPDDVAAIFYLCLALGFHGPYPPGDPKLQKLKEHLAQKLPAPQYGLGKQTRPAAEPTAEEPVPDSEEPMEPDPKAGRPRYAVIGAGVLCLAALFAVLFYWPGGGGDDLTPPADRMEQAANGAAQHSQPLKAKTGGIPPQTSRQVKAVPSPDQTATPKKMPAKPASQPVRIGPKPGGAASATVKKTDPPQGKPAQAKPGRPAKPVAIAKPAPAPDKARSKAAKPKQGVQSAQTKQIKKQGATQPAAERTAEQAVKKAKPNPAPKPARSKQAAEGPAPLLGEEFAAGGLTQASGAKPKAMPAKPAAKARPAKTKTVSTKPAPRATQAEKAKKVVAGAGSEGQVYFLQIGTFNGTEHANKLVRRLKRMNLPALMVEKVRKSGVGSWHVVVTGPYATQKQAQSDKTRMAQKAKLQTIMRVKPRKDWP